METGESTKAVTRTLGLLEVLAEGASFELSELARRVDMHKSTVYRFVTTLCNMGYARQSDDQRYEATLKMIMLGNSLAQNRPPWQDAIRAMEQLSRSTGETIHLATLENDRLVFVHKIESTFGLRVVMRSDIGQSAPLHCTALGKILLAWQSPAGIKALVESNPLVRYTPKTITTKRRLTEELEEIRTTGVALDDEEHETGVRCLATPIWSEPSRTPVAALSISAPTLRMHTDQQARHTQLLLEATKQLSYDIGLALIRPENRRGA
mgnify:FL=1